MSRGKFIVLEGGEGSGKTTIARFLKARLPQDKFLFTREPGGTVFAEKIRAVMISAEASKASAETMFCLIWASRFDHVKNVIRPAIERGINVVSDRFDSSTYAYQIYGQEAPHLKLLFAEFRKLLDGCVPDLYIFLDVKVEEGLRRMRKNNEKEEPIDQFERRKLAFHKRAKDGLKLFLKTVPVAKIDASRTIEQVQNDVLSVVIKTTEK